MLFEVYGNILKDDYNIICYQANCKGIMKSGIAQDIALKYPNVSSRNNDYCRLNEPLGTILPVTVGKNKICVSLYGQLDYGYGRTCRTDFTALQSALNELADRLNHSIIPEAAKIAFPNRMGCGLGSGEWQKVIQMLRDFDRKVRQDVYIVTYRHRNGADKNVKVNSAAG